jgi:hypothetical protein
MPFGSMVVNLSVNKFICSSRFFSFLILLFWISFYFLVSLAKVCHSVAFQRNNCVFSLYHNISLHFNNFFPNSYWDWLISFLKVQGASLNCWFGISLLWRYLCSWLQTSLLRLPLLCVTGAIKMFSHFHFILGISSFIS